MVRRRRWRGLSPSIGAGLGGSGGLGGERPGEDDAPGAKGGAGRGGRRWFGSAPGPRAGGGLGPAPLSHNCATRPAEEPRRCRVSAHRPREEEGAVGAVLPARGPSGRAGRGGEGALASPHERRAPSGVPRCPEKAAAAAGGQAAVPPRAAGEVKAEMLKMELPGREAPLAGKARFREGAPHLPKGSSLGPGWTRSRQRGLTPGRAHQSRLLPPERDPALLPVRTTEQGRALVQVSSRFPCQPCSHMAMPPSAPRRRHLLSGLSQTGGKLVLEGKRRMHFFHFSQLKFGESVPQMKSLIQ